MLTAEYPPDFHNECVLNADASHLLCPPPQLVAAIRICARQSAAGTVDSNHENSTPLNDALPNPPNPHSHIASLSTNNCDVTVGRCSSSSSGSDRGSSRSSSFKFDFQTRFWKQFQSDGSTRRERQLKGLWVVRKWSSASDKEGARESFACEYLFNRIVNAFTRLARQAVAASDRFAA